MKIGLFFGSFNPVHCGHMILAGYMSEFTDLEQVWFIVSPHNPLKVKDSLLQDYHRMSLVKIAIGDNRKLKASDIEFKLPRPSFTINTLTYLFEKFPKNQFVLILGSDNLESFHKWKNYTEILEQVELYIYPRKGSDGGELINHQKVKTISAPLMEISSSFIRDSIKNKKDVRYMMPEKVWEYMDEMNFYRK